MKTVLVTGSAGRVGQAAVQSLIRAGWHVRGYDRVPSPGAHESFVGDLADAAQLRRAAHAANAVIHLAATPDDDEFMTQLLPNNIVGLYNVMEAARLEKVPRVILASTGQVNWWQQQDGPLPIRPESPFTPKHWYAVTKVAAEMAGHFYARQYGMQVLIARLGWCPRSRDQEAELDASPVGRNTYMSPRDAGGFFIAALESSHTQPFAVVYVASQPLDQVIFDLEPTRTLLGWSPVDRWPSAGLRNEPWKVVGGQP